MICRAVLADVQWRPHSQGHTGTTTPRHCGKEQPSNNASSFDLEKSGFKRFPHSSQPTEMQFPWLGARALIDTDRSPKYWGKPVRNQKLNGIRANSLLDRNCIQRELLKTNGETEGLQTRSEQN